MSYSSSTNVIRGWKEYTIHARSGIYTRTYTHTVAYPLVVRNTIFFICTVRTVRPLGEKKEVKNDVFQMVEGIILKSVAQSETMA